MLDFPRSTVFNDIPDKIPRNTTQARLIKVLGKEFYFSISQKEREILSNTLLFAEDEEWLEKYSLEKLGLNDEQTGKYISTSLDLIIRTSVQKL